MRNTERKELNAIGVVLFKHLPKIFVNKKIDILIYSFVCKIYVRAL